LTTFFEGKGKILGIFTRNFNVTFDSLNKFKNTNPDSLEMARSIMGLKTISILKMRRHLAKRELGLF
jgi:hypothetical protein